MPLYEWECPKCGKTREILLPAGKLDKAKAEVVRCECGARMEWRFPRVGKGVVR